jgi:hypothetical protein
MKRLATLALLLTGGCYSVKPLATTSPAPGTRLAVSINDAGRMALGGSMGQEIRTVQGRLLEKDDDVYVLSATGVDYLNGLSQTWRGETVRIGSNMVSSLAEKRFSWPRTVGLVGAGIVVGATLTSKTLPWGPDEPPNEPPGSESGPRGSSRRIGIRLSIPR